MTTIGIGVQSAKILKQLSTQNEPFFDKRFWTKIADIFDFIYRKDKKCLRNKVNKIAVVSWAKFVVIMQLLTG